VPSRMPRKIGSGSFPVVNSTTRPATAKASSVVRSGTTRPPARWWSDRRAVRLGRVATARFFPLGRRYCLMYGRPIAAGGIERPITPATAISVRRYGSAWKSVP
jgi:hypothetical protein